MCAHLHLEEAGAKLKSRDSAWIAGLKESGVIWNIALGIFPIPASEGWCHMGVTKYEFWSPSVWVEILALLLVWEDDLNLCIQMFLHL